MSDDTGPVTSYAGSLPLVVVLASVAGFLDAISLARITHTFVAFQTGNLVLVGLGVGRGEWSEAAPPAVAVVSYVLGSALVPVMLLGVARTRTRVARQRLLGSSTVLLLIEVVTVTVVCGLDDAARGPGRALRYVCIVLSGVAMAFQTPVVRTVEGIPVSSTFSSGMLTRLGQAFGGIGDAVRRPRESVVVRVLGGTVLAFLVGAVLGGALLVPLGNGTVAIPFVALLAVRLMMRRTLED